MKLQFILSRVPYPLEKGDKLRAYQQLKGLCDEYEIDVVAINDAGKPTDDTLHELSMVCNSLEVINLSTPQKIFNLMHGIRKGMPLQVAYFYFIQAEKQIHEIIKRNKPDLIFCQLIRMAEYLRNVEGIPKMLDFQDAFSKGMEQRGSSSSFFLKPFYQYESNAVKQYEKKVFNWFDEKIIIAGQDRDYIDHPRNHEIKIIPNGIDTSSFIPSPEEKKYDLLFVGNMQYEPNVDGVEFLVKEIMPIIEKQYRKVNLLIAGADPHPKVKALASDNVHVSGWIDDITKCYNQSKVFVAPMRIGTGLQNKLLQAMAMKLPCITSSLANNALGAKHRESILVANSEHEFAFSVKKILMDKDLSTRITENAYEYVMENFDMDKVMNKLSTFIRHYDSVQETMA